MAQANAEMAQYIMQLERENNRLKNLIAQKGMPQLLNQNRSAAAQRHQIMPTNEPRSTPGEMDHDSNLRNTPQNQLEQELALMAMQQA